MKQGLKLHENVYTLNNTGLTKIKSEGHLAELGGTDGNFRLM